MGLNYTISYRGGVKGRHITRYLKCRGCLASFKMVALESVMGVTVALQLELSYNLKLISLMNL